jgi:hypothetical protein
VVHLPKHLGQVQVVDVRGLDAASMGAKVIATLETIQARDDER